MVGKMMLLLGFGIGFGLGFGLVCMRRGRMVERKYEDALKVQLYKENEFFLQRAVKRQDEDIIYLEGRNEEKEKTIEELRKIIDDIRDEHHDCMYCGAENRLDYVDRNL